MNRLNWCLNVALTALLLEPAMATAQQAQQRIDEAFRRASEAGVPVPLLQSQVHEGRPQGGHGRPQLAAKIGHGDQLKVQHSVLQGGRVQGAGDLIHIDPDAPQLGLDGDQ